VIPGGRKIECPKLQLAKLRRCRLRQSSEQLSGTGVPSPSLEELGGYPAGRGRERRQEEVSRAQQAPYLPKPVERTNEPDMLGLRPSTSRHSCANTRTDTCLEIAPSARRIGGRQA
jgi:hypothetical protein